MKTYGGVEVRLHALSMSALDGGEWSASHYGRFIPRERALGTLWRGWVGPIAGLDAVAVPLSGIEPWSSSLVTLMPLIS
jgi:hypothetical protein